MKIQREYCSILRLIYAKVRFIRKWPD
uniref:Uncharacterized protein n=1 Tax=Arundo donax TaxID=35708 RepID=A0A0A8YUF0_ARUDO